MHAHARSRELCTTNLHPALVAALPLLTTRHSSTQPTPPRHHPHPPCPLPPAGEVEALLETYDRDRKVLPPPFLAWKWGWTRSAETWNGRIAMLALVLILLLEATTGQGVVMRLMEVHGLLK